MAMLKGRQVELIGEDGPATDEYVIVRYPNGTNERAKLSDVTYTVAEKALLDKSYNARRVSGKIKVIADATTSTASTNVIPLLTVDQLKAIARGKK
jgi:hypothetical protein